MAVKVFEESYPLQNLDNGKPPWYKIVTCLGG
jgi:hypothetical protein